MKAFELMEGVWVNGRMPPEDRTMTSPFATQDSYPFQNEPIWSRSEKIIARTAFEAAMGRQLHEVIQEAKKRASQIQQSLDLWDLESYRAQRRKEIDRKYDYRYSQLTHVFGRLLHERRLNAEELRDLRDKLKPIRSLASEEVSLAAERRQCEIQARPCRTELC